jgi:hypothetical protein
LLYVYLSDLSVEALREGDVPKPGAHIDYMLPVAQELAEWRTPKYPNQLMIDVDMADVHAMERHLKGRIKSNAAMPESMFNVLTAAQAEVGSPVIVAVPQRYLEKLEPPPTYGTYLEGASANTYVVNVEPAHDLDIAMEEVPGEDEEE